MSKFIFGIGLWSVGFTADRFIPNGYRPMESFQKQIELAASIPGVEFVQINYPSNFSGLDPKEVLKFVNDKGLKVRAINTDVFSSDFKYGAFTSPNEKTRRKAIDLVKRAADVAQEIGCQNIEMWPGQDGFDYCFQVDYSYLWDSTVSAVKEIINYAPNIRFSYEYKLKEPRIYMYIANAAKALLLAREIDAKNFGVVIDFGHALLSRENPAEALMLLSKADKLFMVHFNDAYGEYDDDLVAGSVNFWKTLEFIWYLKQISFDGHICLDMFPFRENPVEACSLAIRMIKSIEEIADRLDVDTIKSYQKENDIINVYEQLRLKVFLK